MNDFQLFLKKESQEEYFCELQAFLEQEYASKVIYPPHKDIFHCFSFRDYQDIKVVILGQDPYHEPGQANGLAFSVARGVKVPPSLVNIYKEAHDDVGIVIPSHGDLSAWAQQGVLLLNTVLTVQAHRANSHRGKGWEILTDHVIQMLNQRQKPLVFILWGKQAMDKARMIDQNKHCVLMSPHPSPLSSYRGFFGSKPFSKANQFLISRKVEAIDWRID